MNIDRFRFRAWDKVENRMLSCDELLFHQWDDVPLLVDLLEAMNTNDEFADRYILMQCTGLKDIDGKLIWEGDVLKHTYNDLVDGKGNAMSFYYSVFWNSYKACFALRQLHTGNEMEILMDYKDLTGRTESVKVIGNIYQHPELLK